MAEDRELRIQQRAYALWEQEGCPEGRHEHHWQQACQEAGNDKSQQQGARGPKAPTRKNPSSQQQQS